nr:hypothetical protein GCM10020092_014460 [Actinoplanes digitatis]
MAVPVVRSDLAGPVPFGTRIAGPVEVALAADFAGAGLAPSVPAGAGELGPAGAPACSLPSAAPAASPSSSAPSAP